MLSYRQAKLIDITNASNGGFIFRVSTDGLSLPLPGQYIFFFVNEPFEDGLSKKCLAYILAADKKQCTLYVASAFSAQIESIAKKGCLYISGFKGDSLPTLSVAERVLIVADEKGLAAAVFYSHGLMVKGGLQYDVHDISPAEKKSREICVLLCSDDEFPFRPQPSRIMIPGLPVGVIAACPLLEDRKIASRLASESFMPGCYDGTAASLLREWLPSYGKGGSLSIFVVGDINFSRSLDFVADTFDVRVHHLQLP